MKATESAQLAASFVGKNDKTVRRWRTGVLRNKGVLPQSKQGRYERKGVLWHNENLNKMATQYVSNNYPRKGVFIDGHERVDVVKWSSWGMLA